MLQYYAMTNIQGKSCIDSALRQRMVEGGFDGFG